jgi:hypothetical protein
VNPRKNRLTSNNLPKTDQEAKDRSPAMPEEIREILKRAESGDRMELSFIREALDLVPKMVDIYGNLAKGAERSLIEVMAGKNLMLKEAVPRKLEAMREELAGPSPTPLEKLLVEQVVACWLQLQHAEMLVAQRSFGNMSMQQVELYQRQLDRAHRRYLSAIRTLAQIRKLRPVVQVNIAEQQVNVAQ